MGRVTRARRFILNNNPVFKEFDLSFENRVILFAEIFVHRKIADALRDRNPSYKIGLF